MADLSEKAVRFASVKWCDQAAKHLGLIEGLSPADIERCRQFVSAGESALMAVLVDNRRVGTVMWATFDEPGRKVLMIEEAAAEPVQGADIALAIYQMAKLHGRRIGAQMIRAQTRRAGLLSKLRGKVDTVVYLMEKSL